MTHPSGCCCPHHQAQSEGVDLTLLWLPLLALASCYTAWQLELLSTVASVLVTAGAVAVAVPVARVVVGEIQIRRLYDRVDQSEPVRTRLALPPVPPRAIEPARPDAGAFVVDVQAEDAGGVR